MPEKYVGWESIEPVRQVIANQSGIMKLVGKEFDGDNWPEDSNGEKYVRPGLIVAQVTSAGRTTFVPYSSGASYGTGSDTAVGVFADDLLRVTYFSQAMTPVYHGELLESMCYVLGGSLGTVPAAVKTALSDIKWK